jgi:hypothetical protein
MLRGAKVLSENLTYEALIDSTMTSIETLGVDCLNHTTWSQKAHKP